MSTEDASKPYAPTPALYQSLWHIHFFKYFFFYGISLGLYSIYVIYKQGRTSVDALNISSLVMFLPPILSVTILISNITQAFTGAFQVPALLNVFHFLALMFYGYTIGKAHNEYQGLNTTKYRFNLMLSTVFSIIYINWKTRKNAELKTESGNIKNIGLEFWPVFILYISIALILMVLPYIMGYFIYQDISTMNAAKNALMMMPSDIPLR